MGKVKTEFDQKYIADEMARAQHDTSYTNDDSVASEQYSSPESMHKRQPIAHKGNKSRTKGFVG